MYTYEFITACHAACPFLGVYNLSDSDTCLGDRMYDVSYCAALMLQYVGNIYPIVLK